MKANFLKFRTFIKKHIWADFLLVFIIYFTFQLLSRQWTNNDKSLNELLLSSVGFSLLFTPIHRLIGPDEEEHSLYDLVDHVRYYQIGQRAPIKAFLETQEYSTDYNEGAVSYFKSEHDSIFSSTKTFIHETDHWIALVAPPNILDKVPDTITSIYPKTT